jgi:hypothetical protein
LRDLEAVAGEVVHKHGSNLGIVVDDQDMSAG